MSGSSGGWSGMVIRNAPLPRDSAIRTKHVHLDVASHVLIYTALVLTVSSSPAFESFLYLSETGT